MEAMLHNFLQNIKEDVSHQSLAALRNHQQLSPAIDMLLQRTQQHILFNSQEHALTHEAFAHALARQLTERHNNQRLAEANVFYLNTEQLETPSIGTELYSINFSDKKTILLIHLPGKFSESLTNILREYLANPNWRFIIFTSPENIEQFPLPKFLFSQLDFISPNNIEILGILITQRRSLENFYKITINENIIATAFSLAKRYIPGEALLNKTLTLLECALATENKPELTNNKLIDVVARWTQIPVTNLQLNHFLPNNLVPALQKIIIGKNQNQAILQIGTSLSNSGLKLNDQAKPFGQFLLLNNDNLAQSNLLTAIANYFFANTRAFFNLYIDQKTHLTIDSLQVIQCGSEKNILPLTTAIKRYPYGIFLIDQIESLPSATLALFENILCEGFTIDSQGEKINFSEAMIFLSTAIGKNIIQQQLGEQANKSAPIDLFVEKTSENSSLDSNIIIKAVLPTLQDSLPKWLLKNIEIIPLAPLNLNDLSNIFQQKINQFSQRFEQKSSPLKLQIAPEVTEFLADKLLTKSFANTPEKILEQYLYPRMAQFFMAHPLLKHCTIRLNDTGKYILCEPIADDISTIKLKEDLILNLTD